ncbi:MAG: 50S ribosomal protein L9 [Alphaproteobacteria bacterium]|nr:50S ribosomal protein L9 [Alphaproteobacteria bacterium]
MDVILLERVEKLGNLGQTVKVKPGYARNFLLPQGKALRATKENRARFEAERAAREAANATKRSDASGTAAKVDGSSCVVIRQASDSLQLYGSVTARDIAAALTEGGTAIERRQVILDHAIKVLGLHKVRVALHPEVIVDVTVNVARSPEEAEVQARTGAAVVGGPADEPETPAEAPAEAEAESAA